MENNQPQLNEHNKTEYPPMHTDAFDTSLIKQHLRKEGLFSIYGLHNKYIILIFSILSNTN